MKIKEVSAGVKISKNYNSYSINLVADVSDNENYEKGGKFSEIEIKELEKQKFKQTFGDKTFVFRRIPPEKRKNSRMPVFRIYKLEEEKINIKTIL